MPCQRHRKEPFVDGRRYKIKRDPPMTKDDALMKLRHREVLGYHTVCEIFRAQGYLTPEKLKLLKEIATAFYIPDVRHRAECLVVNGMRELREIAELVAGPGTEVEWLKEANNGPMFEENLPPRQVSSYGLRLANAYAAEMRKLKPLIDSLEEDECVDKLITIDAALLEDDFDEIVKDQMPKVENVSCGPLEQPSDDDTSDSDEDLSSPTSVETQHKIQTTLSKNEFQKPVLSKEDIDATLMPPPPPVSPNQAHRSVSSIFSTTPPVSVASTVTVAALQPPVIVVPSPTQPPHSVSSGVSTTPPGPPASTVSVAALPTPSPVIVVPSPSQPPHSVSSNVSPTPSAVPASTVTVAALPPPVIIVPPSTQPTYTVSSNASKTPTAPPASTVTVAALPPPVIIVPPPIQSLCSVSSNASNTSPVITVPPPLAVPVTALPSTTVTLPETPVEVPSIVETPFVETPVLTEAEEAQARADFLSSLPPLVVVPPPDPSETLALSSPSQRSPSLVLSPGMSIQIRDDSRKRKRSVSQSQESDAGVAVTSAKSLALCTYSKGTPIMVTAAPSPSQTQVKFTPMISRTRMTTTAQSQKVIIVSNNPTSNTPILQRSVSVPLGSLGLPVIRTTQPRFQSVTARGTSGTTLRPKMVTVPAKSRAKGSSVVNLQLKNAITLKQDNVTVVDTSAKKLPGPTKILPKPSGSMFIVNTGHGTHKLATTMAGGREGAKQNVVFVQKGGGQRTLTLSNPNKDFMQKLISKKCVVIQSSKMVPKPISPKPPPPPPSQPPPVISTSGNTVVLDLSQEQDSQNWGGATLREILQASGIMTSNTQTTTTQTLSDAAQVSPGEGEWLSVETSKSLSLEEVSLPIGQSESFVTLDEAVEMLEDQQPDVAVSMGAVSGLTSEMGASEQMFTVTSDQLSGSGGNVNLVTGNSEPMVNQLFIEALPSEVSSDLDCISQPFLPHRDGAVTIQHSHIDVPANMSLEDYSSQQMENQNFN